ncbi:MAG: WGR domain-containing protein [Proteobacteria bacterium]|nr:WGR domain-containing protein [Pseudomonadota bacterium]
MNTEPLSITLNCTEGGSDKAYAAQLQPAGDLWVVNAQWGRRGSSLQTGTKTPAPVAYDKARKIFDKVVAEKLAKGYVTGEGEVAYQNTPDAARRTGIVPQLLNPIFDAAELEALLTDDAWAGQQKFDGTHKLIHKTVEGITGINKKGLVVALPTVIEQAAQSVPVAAFLIDGEDLGDTFVAFDLLEFDGIDLRGQPYSFRHAKLVSVFATDSGTIRASSIWLGSEAKRAGLAALSEQKLEGIVFKRRAAPVTEGRPNSGGDQRKFKFLETASCEVEAITEGKRSVSLRVYDANGNPQNVGRCTIPTNHAVPAIGEIVSVEYLYAFPNGCLFQPQYKGVRSDQDATDCTVAQLKFKADEALLAA